MIKVREVRIAKGVMAGDVSPVAMFFLPLSLWIWFLGLAKYLQMSHPQKMAPEVNVAPRIS